MIWINPVDPRGNQGNNSPNYTMNANLEKRNESSKQRDEDHHASNLSMIALDKHKHPRSNLYYKLINGIAVPGGMLHQWSTKLVVFLTNELNSPNPNSCQLTTRHRYLGTACFPVLTVAYVCVNLLFDCSGNFL